MTKKQVFIILGPPGAGKGTQANLLSDRLGVEHIETSKVGEKFLREHKENYIEVNGEKYYLQDQKKLFRQGELWDPPFVVHILKQKIKETAKQGKGIVFSGSPRTVYEAKKLMPFLKSVFGREKVTVFFLKLSEKDSIFRNSHRRICKLMRHPVLWHEETKDLTICPLDGSRLRKRELDKPKVIKERYKVFEKRTLPIMDWIEEHRFRVERIDGSPSVAKVHKTIMEKV